MSFFKHHKRQDPEIMEQSAIEPDDINAPKPINICELTQLAHEIHQRKLEENPRLDEFENIVKQYVNDFIVFQTNSFASRGKTWYPTTDSVYFCYTRIKGQLMLNEDKEFRDWFLKTNISEIRHIISHEISEYMEFRRFHSRTN